MADADDRLALEAMLSKEMEDTADADVFINNASKAQQALEEGRRAAADAARARLMAEVSKTRLDQIQQHALCK